MSGHERVNPFSRGALRFHVPMLVGVAGCLLAGWFELSRARGGHAIAWVYAFEWPGFAIAGVVIWWRIITNRDDPRPGAPGPATTDPDRPTEDSGLLAWRQYLVETRRRDSARDTDAPR